jgi:hypothetical protein
VRQAVIERDGVLHYALKATYGRNIWYVFCDDSIGRKTYRSDDIQEDFPSCVRCLGEECLRGKDLEPIDLD